MRRLPGSWTIDGGYAAFEQNLKGSLEVGKMVDFIMPSGNVMTMPASEIREAKVKLMKLTVAGVRIVHQK